jgi:hypothetical protein
MTEIDVATEIRRLADEIRAVADGGLRYAADLPYDAARYRHFRRIAAELMSLVDERDTGGIERELFTALSHLAPIPAVSAAVFDDANRILLIRRSDNGHWEMPGGALDPGESPAEAAQREAAEEAGVLVTPTELITVLDTRLEHSSPLQLVHSRRGAAYEFRRCTSVVIRCPSAPEPRAASVRCGRRDGPARCGVGLLRATSRSRR